jgi:hypothetical protein
MNNLPQHIENQFFKILNKEIPIEEFEQWVYATDELETVLSEHDYLNLIAFSFDQLNAFDYLEDLLIGIIDFPKFEKYRLIYQLNIIIEKAALWKNAVETLHGDYINSYNFLEPFFSIHFMIEDNHEFYPQLNENRHQLIEDMYVLAKKEAIQLLDYLNSDKIIIKGREGHRKGTNYIDNRTKEEKARPFFDIKQTKNWWEYWKEVPPQYLH